jgi:hypothetical protein
VGGKTALISKHHAIEEYMGRGTIHTLYNLIIAIERCIVIFTPWQ